MSIIDQAKIVEPVYQCSQGLWHWWHPGGVGRSGPYLSKVEAEVAAHEYERSLLAGPVEELPL